MRELRPRKIAWPDLILNLILNLVLNLVWNLVLICCDLERERERKRVKIEEILMAE